MVYKWYIYGQLGDYISYLPTHPTHCSGTRNNHFSTNLRMFKELFYKQQWVAVAASPAWSFFVEENRTEAVRLFHLLSLGVLRLKKNLTFPKMNGWNLKMMVRKIIPDSSRGVFSGFMLIFRGVTFPKNPDPSRSNRIEGFPSHPKSFGM